MSPVLGTIVRAGEVLRLFTPERPEWGVTEVATTLGIPKSNAHDILSSLAATGLLQHTLNSRYSLGWWALGMSRTVFGSAFLQRASYPELRRLHRRFGGPTAIGVWDGDNVVLLGMLAGASEPDPTPSAVGLAIPAHASAIGKVLLADRCRDVASLRFVDLRPVTDRSITSAELLMTEISEVRRCGYGTSVGELMVDLGSVAIAVRDRQGAVIAALAAGVDCHQFALRAEELRAALAESVAWIARRLSDPR